MVSVASWRSPPILASEPSRLICSRMSLGAEPISKRARGHADGRECGGHTCYFLLELAVEAFFGVHGELPVSRSKGSSK